jgi:hypothetical protein
LREVEVKLAGDVVDMGLLDDGSEIVVVRKDLWEKLGYGAHEEKKMLMQVAYHREYSDDGRLCRVFRIGDRRYGDLGTCIRGSLCTIQAFIGPTMATERVVAEDRVQ